MLAQRTMFAASHRSKFATCQNIVSNDSSISFPCWRINHSSMRGTCTHYRKSGYAQACIWGRRLLRTSSAGDCILDNRSWKQRRFFRVIGGQSNACSWSLNIRIGPGQYYETIGRKVMAPIDMDWRSTGISSRESKVIRAFEGTSSLSHSEVHKNIAFGIWLAFLQRRHIRHETKLFPDIEDTIDLRCDLYLHLYRALSPLIVWHWVSLCISTELSARIFESSAPNPHLLCMLRSDGQHNLVMSVL